MAPANGALLRRWRASCLLGVALANLSVLAAAVALRWPRYWEEINGDGTARAWLSTVQLLFIAAVCLGNAARQRLQSGRKTLEGSLWTALAGGFAFLSLEQRFEVHENVREYLLKPRHFGTSIPGVNPGDVVMLGYAAAGLAIAYPVMKVLTRRARILFGAAIALSFVAVCMDAADVQSRTIWFQRSAKFWEKMIETAAEMSFLYAFTEHFWQRTIEQA